MERDVKRKAAVLAGVLALLTSTAFAAEEYTLVIKDHRFEPAELAVPAGRKVKLVIENQDTAAEEFESHDLNREKVIGGKSRATVFVGPLKAGKYKYFGEFHEDTAQGQLIAKEA